MIKYVTWECGGLASQILGLLEVLHEHVGLGGLAGAVKALEDDEHASLLGARLH